LIPEQWQRARELFEAALARGPEERADFLRAACGADAELLAAVHSLLRAHDEAGSFLDKPAVELQAESAMLLCPSCTRTVPADDFCRACGAALDPSSVPTRQQPPEPQPPGPRRSPAAAQAHQASPLDSHSAGRFVAGTMLAGRYRIVGLLGQGGMGKVYKAEDLKLNQTVALKFLPDALALDGAMLARFHNEVRTARQITHPNVCRVHDIGEEGGLHFISMEFIDGEDLSSLLRRIGRLPTDKAVELARQLCSGLAAAHENGVLHRDLKPANVMIDGRGRARITDFGLAVVSAELSGAEVLAGTPAYMAPEQLAGKEATPRSDIYALGLVLYELFTGKRAYEAQSVGELIALHEKSTPPTPSSHVKDIDPLAERVIMRCLEKAPHKRPASAVQVALALPGGDPLQAALAAGETPSPEMVAAAGGEAGLRPAVAVACLAAVVVGLFVAAWMNGKTRLIHHIPFDNSPEVLAHKAREISAQLGYPTRPADKVWDFIYNTEYLRHVRQNDSSPVRWNHLQSQAILFRYRESPQQFQSIPDWFYGGQSISFHLPASLSGMVNLGLDPQGRLLWFSAVPKQDDEVEIISPNWATLLRSTGIDPSRFTQAGPQWIPQTAFDARTAWEGTSADRPELPLRIEMATWRGRLVYFEIVYPWVQQSRVELLRINQSLSAYYVAACLIAPIIALLIAWLNRRRGKGDYQGALRLTCSIYLLFALLTILSSKYPSAAGEVAYTLMGVLSFPLYGAFSVGLCYFAFEPYVRRYWPATIISWSRMITGRVRDAMVGRDVLVGILCGIFVYLLGHLRSFHYPYLPEAKGGNLSSLLGMRMASSQFFLYLGDAIQVAVGWLFIFFFLRVLSRRQWLAAGLFILLRTIADDSMYYAPMKLVPYSVFIATVLVFLILRSGLVGLISSLVALNMLDNFPVTFNFSAWYADSGIFVSLAVLALAAWGFYTSLGGQKVFQSRLLEE
jgi:serine/threonine protein kinase